MATSAPLMPPPVADVEPAPVERALAHRAGEDPAGSPGLRVEELIPCWSRPPYPHLGGPRTDVADAAWWWLAVHGGAGVTTLAAFVPSGADAFRRWPAPLIHEGPRSVILVCRTDVRSLQRACTAVRQWQQSAVPDGLHLAGLVAVAAAPGRRLPRPQAEMLRLLDGAVSAIWSDASTPARLWTVPWLPELHVIHHTSALSPPPPLVRLSIDLDALRVAARVAR